MIDVHRNQVTDFLYYLERAGIIAQLRGETGGIRLLGKVEKVYLDNTNLIYALAENKSDIGNIRETFFLSQRKCTMMSFHLKSLISGLKILLLRLEAKENSKSR